MGQKVSPIREGFNTITPYLMVDNVNDLIKFMQQAFNAELKCKFDRNDESVMHAELKIGDSMIMAGEANEKFARMPASIYLYVEDCDAVYAKAIKAGGVSVMEPTDMYHAGERYGGVKDTTENIWWIATHIEDVSVEEEKRRIKNMK